MRIEIPSCISKALVASALLMPLFLQPANAEQKSEPISAKQAGSVLAKTCFASYPNFANFDANAKAAGLVPGPAVGPLRHPYYVPGSTMYVGSLSSPAGPVCVASIHSKDSKQAVGKAVQSAARAVGGKGQVKKWPTSFYQFAIQLPNGSLVTQDYRSAPGKDDMNIIGVTGPITDADVPLFIYK